MKNGIFFRFCLGMSFFLEKISARVMILVSITCRLCNEGIKFFPC